MATLAYTRTVPDSGHSRVHLYLWTLGNADDGVPVQLAQLADRSVQVGGTFGGATVVIEGSIDGVTYHTLTDPQGNPLSFTAAGLEAVSELVAYLRPRSSGGAGTSVNAYLLAKLAI